MRRVTPARIIAMQCIREAVELRLDDGSNIFRIKPPD